MRIWVRIVSVFGLLFLSGCRHEPLTNPYGYDLRPRYDRDLKMVAHRGESSSAPENTVPAYELAWRNHVAWGVETDVHLTKDGVLVCCHDEDTERTTGVKGKIEDMTLAELKRLDAGSWKGRQWLGTRIPTLREVLATLPPDGHVFVEIKKAGEGFKKAFTEAFNGAGVRLEQVSFISFDVEELKRVKGMLPNNRILQLMNIWDHDGVPSPTAEELIEHLTKLGFTGADVHAYNNIVDAEYIQKVHDAGFEIHFWTVNVTSKAKGLAKIGADSITTDKPRQISDEWESAELPHWSEQ